LNPYAAPQAGISLAEPIVRKRWIATVLGFLVPPIGMLYVVRPLRAAVYLAIAIVLMPASVLLGAQGIVSAQLVIGVGGLAWRVAGAIDAFRLARAWKGAPLPWYSRAPALAGFFLAGLLVIGSIRAFLYEPFRMPSASMRPTLQVGDHILVKKYTYGWNVPFTAQRLARFAGPQRGDVAVFRFPPDPSLDYVMRVVALPGETVVYANKRLRIDGREMPITRDGEEASLMRYKEQLGEVSHGVLHDPAAPTRITPSQDFEGRDACRYDDAGFSCKVPAQRYFVMGDNRDNTNDSRYWGFVPEDYFVGRAFLIWHSEQEGRAGGAVR
jgi:signal peptidase I